MNTIHTLFSDGKTQKEIASTLNISQSSVSRIVSKLQLKRDNLLKKVTDDQIRSHNGPITELSSKFNISSQSLCRLY